ncbi:MFS transporter [Clostridium zeae]|uniref:MFS transporter n=1 Tax=Clostridium zeae TaxID=2759022 RepID=A0ABQ1EE43_9CLOT|nr:MFS transporter [Clostridium zeae]GFZ33067.1 MFS transporter [Clostridium zeae]
MFVSILSLKKLFKNKESSNVILFSVASFISLFGTSVYNFAISLFVLKLTGSGLSFATTLIMGILSTVLVNPFAGVLADRLDKKLLAIITDMLNGILLIILYLLSISFTLNLPIIYVSTFILNVFSTVYGISIEAARPNLVSEKRLISINAINKVIESISSILGPIIGGMVFALLDIRFFIIINSFSFVVSAFLQLFMDFKLTYVSNGKPKEMINFFADILEGITYLRDKKNISNMFAIFIVLNFFIGLSITVPMPYIINNVLKLNTKFFGIIEGAFPIGMIFGAIMIKRIIEKYSYKSIIKSTSMLLSACMSAIGFSVILHQQINNENVFLIYFILVMILAGIAISAIDIPIFYILQQAIPDEYRGRVLSIGMSIAKIILPIALVLAGALINHIPTYILPILSGVGLYIFTLFYIKIN